MSYFNKVKKFFIKKVLRQRTLEAMLPFLKILSIIAALAIVALSAQSVTTTQDKLALKIEEFDRTSKVSSSPSKQNRGNAIPENLSAPINKLFGPIGVATPSASKGPSESALPLSLIGVFLPDHEDHYAIIQDDKKNLQEVFGVGDSIFDAAKLTKIFPDKVEINRNGTKEILIIDSNTKAGAATTEAASEGEFTVDEAELDQALENLPLLLTQARAVPYFKDGKAVGLRVFAIRTGSLFEKIGLQNGDVLKSVNGNSLADLSQAMQLFQKLKEERSIELALERNMSEKTFKYQIK